MSKSFASLRIVLALSLLFAPSVSSVAAPDEDSLGKDAAGDASNTHLTMDRDALFRGVVAQYGHW